MVKRGETIADRCRRVLDAQQRRSQSGSRDQLCRQDVADRDQVRGNDARRILACGCSTDLNRRDRTDAEQRRSRVSDAVGPQVESPERVHNRDRDGTGQRGLDHQDVLAVVEVDAVGAHIVAAGDVQMGDAETEPRNSQVRDGCLDRNVDTTGARQHCRDLEDSRLPQPAGSLHTERSHRQRHHEIA